VVKLVVKGGFYSGKVSYLSLSAILLRSKLFSFELRRDWRRRYEAIPEFYGLNGEVDPLAPNLKRRYGMNIVLLISGAVSLIFGAMLLLVPAGVKRLSDIFNQVILDFDGWVRKLADIGNRIILNIDEKIEHSRKVCGIVFVVLSVIMFYTAVKK
jgi:hypothetical protein